MAVHDRFDRCQRCAGQQPNDEAGRVASLSAPPCLTPRRRLTWPTRDLLLRTHPFVAPAASPETMCRWRKMKISRTGAAIRAAVAIKSFHAVPY